MKGDLFWAPLLNPQKVLDIVCPQVDDVADCVLGAFFSRFMVTDYSVKN